jgi:hypothetical protein
VCELIQTRFGIQIAQKTAGAYLRRAKVKAWLDERYPAIEKQARKEGAEILWGDEMGLRSDHTSGTTWSPVGQTPVVKGTAKRFKTNMIAVVSNTGTLRFRVF